MASQKALVVGASGGMGSGSCQSRIGLAVAHLLAGQQDSRMRVPRGRKIGR